MRQLHRRILFLECFVHLPSLLYFLIFISAVTAAAITIITTTAITTIIFRKSPSGLPFCTNLCNENVVRLIQKFYKKRIQIYRFVTDCFVPLIIKYFTLSLLTLYLDFIFISSLSPFLYFFILDFLCTLYFPFTHPLKFSIFLNFPTIQLYFLFFPSLISENNNNNWKKYI